MIDSSALGFALAAGLVAALNPCGFAFLPAYLGLVTADASGEASTVRAVGRALAATAAMSGGFLTVFGLFGVAISPVLATAQRYLPFVTVAIGILLVGLGAWLLAGKDLAVMMPQLRGGAPTSQLRSSYGYGISYALASLSCTVAPFLAVIGATFRQGSMLTGVLAFIAYAGGMTITVGVAALAVALAGSMAADALRRVLPYVSRAAGALVLVTGLYVAYYGYYEIRLFFFDSSPDDPVIGAAAQAQTWLADHVNTIGAWPLAAAILILAAVALLWRVRRRKHTAPEHAAEEPVSER